MNLMLELAAIDEVTLPVHAAVRPVSNVRSATATCVCLAALWLPLATLGADKNGVSPSAISLPKGPGSLEGLGESFQPTLNTGTASYGMSISLPPGTAGHQPSLRLRYEGGGGNGVLGYGWSLPLPMVQRRSDQGIPLYDEDLGFDRPDRFINETKEELVPQADGYYFCENEGAFVRYRQVSGHWEGTLPDGTKLEFGLTASSRIEDAATGRIFGWLLERETDTRGNTIVYSYRSFEGEPNRNQKFLSSISYGPGAPPWTNFHFVVFDYEDRSDWFEDCRSGFVVRCGKRMRRIVTGTQGPELPGHLKGEWSGDGQPDFLNRQYELGYLSYAGTNTHWSLLASVQIVGSDGTSRLPATTLGYAVCNPPPTLSAKGKALGGTNEPTAVMDSEFVELADVNGDGLPDLFRTFGGDLPHQAFLNKGVSKAAQAVQWQSALEIKGDARAWNVNLQSALAVAHLADMNGDGLADLVVKAGTDDVFFFANQGNLRWGDRQRMAAPDTLPPSPFGITGVRTADLDFDKRMDVMQSLNTGGGIAYRIWFNLGDQRYAPSLTVEPEGAFDLADPTVQIGDFNGDRLPDLIRLQAERLQVKAGLGYGRFAEVISVPLPGITASPEQLRRAKLTDVTGDGMVDLVLERAAPGQFWYWINRGNYQLGIRNEIVDMPLVIGQRTVVRWADMNGNGTTDLIYADAASEPRLQTIDVGEIINCGATPNILNSIANGLGRVTTIGYRSSIEFRLEDEAAGKPWPNTVPFAVPVVAEVRVADSLGHEYLTEYRYHDGYYDPKQKQFRGFARAEQIERGDATAPSLVTRSFFDTGHLYESMKGKLLRQMAEEQDGRVYWTESTTWTIPPLVLKTGTNGQTVKIVHPLASSTIISELGQGVERVTETESTYDQFGNQTMSVDYGIVENGDRTAFNDERVTTTEYALNLDAWILRHPKRQEVKSLNGPVISRTESFYDDETFGGENLGLVSIGNLTLEREWVEPSNPSAYIKGLRNKYDAYGNAIMLLDPRAEAPGGAVDFAEGHAREVTYDPRFHSYAVVETIHVGGGKPPLVFRAAYDEAFGTVISSTDFNTNTTFYSFDQFARLTSISKPGDTPGFPTSEYSYALAVPVGTQGLVNFTETRLLDQVPGSHANKMDHYFISREFMDGLGRSLMSKKEAEPHRADSSPAVVVSGAMTFNARRSTSLALNPFFSLAGENLEELLDYESLESVGWKGLFHDRGELVSLTLEQAHKTSSWYDGTLREIRSVNPDGSFEKTVYEPLLIRSYDANQTDPGSPYFGASMTHFQDGLGRLIRVDEIVRLNDDGTPAGATKIWTTRYERDLNDQLTRITDSQNNVKVMSYDALTRKISMNDPDRGLMRFFHDDASNLIESVDAKGQRITYTYDGANRILGEDYHEDNAGLPRFEPSQPITPQNRPDVAYFYDVPVTGLDAGDGTKMTAENTVGTLSHVWDQTGEEHYTYDSRDRATAIIKRVIDPLHGQLVSYRTGYTFDSLNRLASVVCPDNNLVRYEYNERSLTKSVTRGPTGSIISNMLYSPAGQLTLVAYGNGVQTTSSYDSSLRLQHMRTRQPHLGIEHVRFAYEFDPASNVRLITDLRPSSSIPDGSSRRNTQSVDYDDLYRMIGVRYSFAMPGMPIRNDGEIRYRYDRIGNMLSQTSNIPHFDKGLSVTDLGAMDYGGSAGRTSRIGRQPDEPPGPHALTEIQNLKSKIRNYRYDANGNMLDIDGLNATWDTKDRLIAVENSEMRAAYNYDYRDRRVIKKVVAKGSAGAAGSQIDSTIYIDQYFEIRQNGVSINYVWCGNARVARLTGSVPGNQRLQRLRLWRGWNLCSFGVTAEKAREQLAAGGAVVSLLRWDEADRNFKDVAPTDTVAAGTVLWLEAVTNVTVAVRGVYGGTAGPSQASAAGVFHPGARSEVLDFEQFAPAHAGLWRFEAESQRWQAGLPGALSGVSDLPNFVVPAEGVFVRADSEAALLLPDEALGIRFYHQDHLGSSAVITDMNGRAVEETSFYPFGFPRHKQTSLKQSDPYQFTQKEQDRESGLNYLEARFQSPILGRFLRIDPLAGAMKSTWLDEPQRLNLYAYCANSPIGHADPSGTELVAGFKGFGGGVAGAVWEAVPKDKYLLNPATAGPATVVYGAVALYKGVASMGNRAGDAAYATSQGDFKKAAMLALVDDRVVKMMDPKTSDEEMGKIIGQATGQALVVIGTAAATGGGGPKGSPPPTVKPPTVPPARVTVPTVPQARAPATVPKTTVPRAPAGGGLNPAGAGKGAQNIRNTAQRTAQRTAHNQRWNDYFYERLKESQPMRDKILQEKGSSAANRELSEIFRETDAIIGPRQ